MQVQDSRFPMVLMVGRVIWSDFGGGFRSYREACTCGVLATAVVGCYVVLHASHSVPLSPAVCGTTDGGSAE
ncbi:hypothetical protein P280DRAFT_465615 [Massarina eburnea CBS 473.64]|uniref:Uncharacterized protein n=1 Tax=Massarina eburnea CBS 473.64 TaxID=1395130 RepID=A0A6A6SHG0_9PLEO|nr:hypothetical protein P280DRAFT_465615 [Massarina eburnea CBS 473.64]